LGWWLVGFDTKHTAAAENKNLFSTEMGLSRTFYSTAHLSNQMVISGKKAFPFSFQIDPLI
jgi:hypothetical protein